MFGVVSVCVCVRAGLGLQQDTLPSRGPVSGSWGRLGPLQSRTLASTATALHNISMAR